MKIVFVLTRESQSSGGLSTTRPTLPIVLNSAFICSCPPRPWLLSETHLLFEDLWCVSFLTILHYNIWVYNHYCDLFRSDWTLQFDLNGVMGHGLSIVCLYTCSLWLSLVDIFCHNVTSKPTLQGEMLEHIATGQSRPSFIRNAQSSGH